MKKIKSWLNIIVLTAILIAPGLVFAASPLTERLEKVAVQNGPFTAADEMSLAVMLGIVVQAALSLLGVVFLVITVIAGYKWMTAEGNESVVKQSKDSITRAIIGLAVTISSWAIWYFISINFINKV